MAMQQHPLIQELKLGTFERFYHTEQGASPNKIFRTVFVYSKGRVVMGADWKWEVVADEDEQNLYWDQNDVKDSESKIEEDEDEFYEIAFD